MFFSKKSDDTQLDFAKWVANKLVEQKKEIVDLEKEIVEINKTLSDILAKLNILADRNKQMNLLINEKDLAKDTYEKINK